MVSGVRLFVELLTQFRVQRTQRRSFVLCLIAIRRSIQLTTQGGDEIVLANRQSNFLGKDGECFSEKAAPQQLWLKWRHK